MNSGTDRRSVLTGLGALGVAGCSPLFDDLLDWRREMTALEARHGGRLGIAVSQGRSFAHRPNDRFVYCSTFKMYLAAATLERVQRGEEQLDRTVPVTRADMVDHAPVTQPAVGTSLTIETLCQAVVEVSDNPAANILIRELGGLDVLRGWYRSIGDQSTTVDRLEPMMNRLDGDKDTTTPMQCVANLERLFLSAETPLIAEHKAKLLGWMFTSPTGVARIKAGVPAGWRVAHKTGTGGYGPTNDIGIIYPPAGEPILIAIYFHATSASTPAQREAVIADATKAALASLGHAA